MCPPVSACLSSSTFPLSDTPSPSHASWRHLLLLCSTATNSRPSAAAPKRQRRHRRHLAHRVHTRVECTSPESKTESDNWRRTEKYLHGRRKLVNLEHVHSDAEVVTDCPKWNTLSATPGTGDESFSIALYAALSPRNANADTRLCYGWIAAFDGNERSCQLKSLCSIVTVRTFTICWSRSTSVPARNI